MSVNIRPYRRGGWEVDIRVLLPDGTEKRERRKSPVPSKSGSERWGRDREAFLLRNPYEVPRKEVPTLEEFAPRFLEGYALAERQKPSGRAAKETVLRIHLLPLLGRKRLDAITNEDVQKLKGCLRGNAPKTVNNVLTVLSKLLKVAVEWDVIDRMPCAIRLYRLTDHQAAFHDFGEYERLVEVVSEMDWRAHLLVLLGGDAGLRCGEMMALEWTDVDLAKRQIRVQRSDWKGHVTSPKGGRPRIVPLTSRLAQAIHTHRHLRGPRVLCEDDGRPLTQKRVRVLVQAAARRANLANQGVHVLRHTFCSHLAMRGAPAKAIQELAGHKDLSTTQGYMHLSPAAVEASIRLLEQPAPASQFGDMLETGNPSNVKPEGLQ